MDVPLKQKVEPDRDNPTGGEKQIWSRSSRGLWATKESGKFGKKRMINQLSPGKSVNVFKKGETFAGNGPPVEKR